MSRGEETVKRSGLRDIYFWTSGILMGWGATILEDGMIGAAIFGVGVALPILPLACALVKSVRASRT
jgi:hypothetical protein